MKRNQKSTNQRAAALPAAQRRGHPLARQLFSQLRYRSEADRRFVFIALTETCGLGGATAAQEGIVEQMRRYVERFGEAPSRQAWDRFRADQDDPGAWPSSKKIRYAFGSWSAAREALGSDARADVTSLRLLATGKAFTAEDLLAAVRACGTDLGRTDFTLAQYRAWAKRKRAEGLRIPTAERTLGRLFATWREALRGAFPDAEPARSPRGVAADYTHERFVELLRMASRDVDAARLTKPAFERWAADYMRGNPGVVVPRAATIALAFGSWAVALSKAGVIDPDGLAVARTASTEKVTDEEATLALALVMQALGDLAPTRRAYDKRAGALRGTKQARGVRLPRGVTIGYIFGGWSKACEHVSAQLRGGQS